MPEYQATALKTWPPTAEATANETDFLITINNIHIWCPRSESNQRRMITNQLHDLHATGAAGTPGGDRTPSLPLRRRLLYPVELQALGATHKAGRSPVPVLRYIALTCRTRHHC